MRRFLFIVLILVIPTSAWAGGFSGKYIGKLYLLGLKSNSVNSSQVSKSFSIRWSISDNGTTVLIRDASGSVRIRHRGANHAKGSGPIRRVLLDNGVECAHQNDYELERRGRLVGIAQRQNILCEEGSYAQATYGNSFK